MNGQPPSAPGAAPQNQGLSPVQIGACVGAAVACLTVLVARDLSGPVSPPGDGGISPGLLLGIWSGLGAIAGMAIVALASHLRRRTRNADHQPTAEGPQALAPGGQPDHNGSPTLRVLSGVVAVLFAVTPIVGRWAFNDVVLMEVLAAAFAWYAAFGRRGRPRSL